MEWVTLGIFCAGLIVCVAAGWDVLIALVFGWALFCLYGRRRGCSWRSLLCMSRDGIRPVTTILCTFLLIGMLTALWRAAGTIPLIVCLLSGLIRPGAFLLLAFLLNCILSVLTGTSFGTAATMGVITMTVARTMGISPLWTGGAILAGVYFGDRCSPVSTSALLVSRLTDTDLYRNIRNMLRSAAVPFAGTCGIYLIAGLCLSGDGAVPDVRALFAAGFRLHWASLLPAVAVLVLSLLRAPVQFTLLSSILLAAGVSVVSEGMSPAELPGLLLSGYTAKTPELAAMLDGGGIVSMVHVALVVTVASSYSGLFAGTGLLDGVQEKIGALAGRTGVFPAVALTALVSGMISCNQSLAILLSHQLCVPLAPDREQIALDLEDSAVVLPPLIPWSIAGAVPLATVGAPTASILAACFLYLLPLWRIFRTAAGNCDKSVRKS